MTEDKGNISLQKDRDIENIMGNLLRTGVIAAAVVVAIGAVLYLMKDGFGSPDYSHFKGEPAGLKSLGGIVKEAFSLSSRGIMQLGLLILIATPVARVVFAIIGFAYEKDHTYTIVSIIVLGILMISLLT